ncbi:MAG: hypothetical protein EOO06_13570 [Chitinophagaceae bacterium]|nr:MAG: hypothetical protein EOO06_13570 [Chitinophagaceae bacterium]
MEPVVAVFKTDVSLQADASIVVKNLLELIPHSRINFDLADCDNILRIETQEEVDPSFIQRYVSELGYVAELLD